MKPVVPTRQHAVKRAPAPGARTAEGDAFSALVIQIFQLNGRLLAAGDALSAPAGQTSARWQVLAAVEQEPRPVASIARLLGLARQSVQRVADLLEQEGLARYIDNPSHQRAKLLQLTATGQATLLSIASAQHAWANRVGEELTLPLLQRTSRALARVLELVAEDEAE